MLITYIGQIGEVGFLPEKYLKDKIIQGKKESWKQELWLCIHPFDLD